MGADRAVVGCLPPTTVIKTRMAGATFAAALTQVPRSVESTASGENSVDQVLVGGDGAQKTAPVLLPDRGPMRLAGRD